MVVCNQLPMREIVYRSLVDDILSGRIKAGERLCEAHLAKRFQVSRTPIREALLQLQEQDLVEHTKHVGAVVKKLSARQVDETYEIVALLEAHAVEVSVPKMTKADVDLLQTLQDKMRQCLALFKFSTYVKLNAQFHDFFCKKSGNAKLRDTALELRKSIYRVVVEGQTLPQHGTEYLESHDRILRAVRSNIPTQAAELMKSHIVDSKAFILEALLNAARQSYYR